MIFVEGATDVLLIGVAIFVVTLLLVVLAFPWRLLRQAASNARRPDGTFSRARARIEVRKGVSFLGEVVLVPLLATTVLIGACFGVDRYLIPLPLLRDVVSLFDPRFSVWDEAMETGRFGDVGITYGEWARSRGYSQNVGVTLRHFLKNNWLALTLIAVTLVVAVYWFVLRYYLAALQSFYSDLQVRSERYRRLDIRRLLDSESGTPSS